jgi:hypothetical protein
MKKFLEPDFKHRKNCLFYRLVLQGTPFKKLLVLGGHAKNKIPLDTLLEFPTVEIEGSSWCLLMPQVFGNTIYDFRDEIHVVRAFFFAH